MEGGASTRSRKAGSASQRLPASAPIVRWDASVYGAAFLPLVHMAMCAFVCVNEAPFARRSIPPITFTRKGKGCRAPKLVWQARVRGTVPIASY